MGTNERKGDLTRRAQQLVDASEDFNINIGKIGAVLGCNESYFRTSIGSRPGKEISQRFSVLFPNVSPSWFFGGIGTMLTSGDKPLVPSLLLYPSVKIIKQIMVALYGRKNQSEPNKELAEKLLRDCSIDPAEIYRLYPSIFPILAPSVLNPQSSTDSKDSDTVECETPADVPTPASDNLVTALRIENKILREQLDQKNATIEQFLKLAMHYIEENAKKND